ncbi:MAG: 2-C-methyl-D-erythritol 4-phosphate cytidylyltransferase [Cellulomonadaceae bacterium]|nr:2-C-methyl-D-erythritol 4-phosphate cytidylyltransferase [Cellulomonadaceae bacterium]
MSVHAIVTAAGSGTRLGRDVPKALVELDGVPLVVRAVEAMTASGVVDTVVVTAPAEHLDQFHAVLLRVGAALVTVVPGGATRQESVALGLAALTCGNPQDIILVHDAARPLISTELIQRVVAAVEAGHDAVIPGLTVTDTIKSVDSRSAVVETVDRTALRAIQTPQAFRRELLERAHAVGADVPTSPAAPATPATDDAGLVEALGEPVTVVEGEARAMKVTTEEDLRIAEVLYG